MYNIFTELASKLYTGNKNYSMSIPNFNTNLNSLATIPNRPNTNLSSPCNCLYGSGCVCLSVLGTPPFNSTIALRHTVPSFHAAWSYAEICNLHDPGLNCNGL